MGLACPECGDDYDVTLFEFGRSVKCECGATATLESGHTRRARKSPPSRESPTDPPRPDSAEGRS